MVKSAIMMVDGHESHCVGPLQYPHPLFVLFVAAVVFSSSLGWKTNAWGLWEAVWGCLEVTLNLALLSVAVCLFGQRSAVTWCHLHLSTYRDTFTWQRAFSTCLCVVSKQLLEVLFHFSLCHIDFICQKCFTLPLLIQCKYIATNIRMYLDVNIQEVNRLCI